MTKDDVIKEFEKKLDKIEKSFINDMHETREYYKLHLPAFSESDSTIGFRFNHEFYWKGHKCKIKFNGEIKVYNNIK